MTMFTNSRILFALTALALAGCRIEKPATVVPKPPSIDAFTTSAAVVARGGTVTLTWSVTEATAIELREASGAALSVPEDQLTGTTTATLDRASLFVLTARGPGGTDARALKVSLEGEAGSVTFQAIPPSIPGGTSSTLTWTAPGASSVTLAAGATLLDVEGQLTAGARVVQPQFDTTYTLTVDGVAHTTQVDVQPALLSLTATPPAVQPGQQVTLAWTAAGAQRVEVSAAGRGVVHTVTDAASISTGTFAEAAPNLPNGSFVTYTVAAIDGTTRMERTLDVNVGSALAIVRLDAPEVASAGGPYNLRWQTVAANSVEVLVDGAVVHTTGTPSEAAAGQYSFTAPTRDFVVGIVARDTRNAEVSRTALVDAVGVPTTLTLAAAPTSVAAGAPVTLTWACTDARSLRLVDDQGFTVFSTTGQLAEGGSTSLTLVRDTTFTATATNLLGSAPLTATASVTVTGGTPLALVQSPPTALEGQIVTLSPNQAGAVLSGIAHQQVLTGSRADFIDISTTGTRVLELGGNVASATLPFSTVLWGTRQSGPLTISRAGWMAWNAPLLTESSETSLPSRSAMPFIVAPYWDDLTLTANSSVLYQVVGQAPNEVLIVQWNRMQCGTTTSSEATFQVRVHQHGRLSFHYLKMTLNSSPSFVVGTQDFTRTLAVRSTATPTTDSALYFFSPVTSAEVRVNRDSPIGGFATLNGTTSWLPFTPRAVRFGQEIAISEFMFRPSLAVPQGQFVELVNTTSTPMDLAGWQVVNPGNSTRFDLSSVTLAPNVPLVLGQTTDATLNDDAGVSLVWGGLVLEPDAGTLQLGTADASVGLTYRNFDGGRGESIELQPNVMSSGGLGFGTCAPGPTYGEQVPAQVGTPGLARRCFPYTVASIPSRYVDLTDGGTRLINSTSAVTSQTVAVRLGTDAGTDPAPQAFGMRHPVVSMSVDGWLTWGSMSSTDSSNDTTTLTTDTLAAIAVFWDDLQTVAGLTPASDMYWKYFAANEDPATPAQHWVFQWRNVRHASTSPVDDLNFEVMLFDDGVVEYHYGAMSSGTASLYANGHSATVWLKSPAGTAALVWSVERPIIKPNTAVRFTPVP